jgi:HlyD family secretion protein
MKYSIHARAATEPTLEVRAPSAPRTGPLLQAPAPQKPFRSLTILVAVVVLFAVAAAFLVLRRGGTNTKETGQTGTATVETEDFVKVVRLTGTTNAVHSRPMLAPALEGAQLSSMVITKLVHAGTQVHKGDVLVEFDRQAQLKDALDKRAAYQDLVDQVAQKRAGEESNRAKDETELKQAEDDLKKAELEVTKNDIVSRIDAEKNQETLEEDQASLKQLQQTFQLKREAAAADIGTLDIQATRAKETMLYAEDNATKMTLKSPMDGVVVLNMVWTGGRMGELQEGDQVRPGQTFMKVVDPSQMQVSVAVNQADFLGLQVGQHARVFLDAYPGMAFDGRLEELTPLAHTGRFSDKVRTFSAVFSIEGNNPKLMPDLSAAVDVELDSRKKALVLPVQSVKTEGGHDYVWVRDGSSFEKHEVKTGPRNDFEVVIESGLKSGDLVRRDAVTSAAAGPF